MATGPSPAPQRTWRALCPQCGAPVDFASAASPVAVCSFCRSTLAREGEALRRIGQSAELFDDHSPLQLGASGRHAGEAFTLLGRLQMQYAQGRWNEWALLFDNGRRGWLAEDNGRYVLGFDAALAEPDARAVATPGALALGAGLALAGQRWQVGAITQARVAAAEGELPAPPPAGAYTLVELRNSAGEVGTLDYGDPARVAWSVGRGVELAALQLSGLRQASEKTLSARTATCPSCGAALQIQLQSTQSIVCGQCQAVVDVSRLGQAPGQSLGADLAHFAQTARSGKGPLIPLGTTGTLALGDAPRPWQVVGYLARCALPESDDDEREYWQEYLLYNRDTGFTFLVDAEDGWSFATPITGVPELRGDSAQWGGRSYRQAYAYSAETTHVLGEFYWVVERGQRSRNTDYTAGDKRLNREQSLPAPAGQAPSARAPAGAPTRAAAEITWSAGNTLKAETVALAFGLDRVRSPALTRDAKPLAAGGGGLARLFVLMLALAVLVVVVRACSRDDCDQLRDTFGASSNEYRACQQSRAGSGSGVRSSGGSWGGFGGGGSHK